jgi:hypothetical protein
VSTKLLNTASDGCSKVCIFAVARAPTSVSTLARERVSVCGSNASRPIPRASKSVDRNVVVGGDGVQQTLHRAGRDDGCETAGHQTEL